MSNPPIGTITFLFTDIEGSTRLWEEFPKQMGAALARHDEILRSVIEAYDGYVFKTVGDAFCASFASPVPAVLAALTTQRNLDREDWGETGPIRVRSAIHTGLAESRDGDYFGQPLNRVARILSTAYGGQILLSDPTCDLIRDDLPQGVGLLDLGMHRLKDLQRPEHLFQLVVPDLQGEFPPLKSLDNRPNNLPVERGLLIGREHELEQARQLLLRPDVGVLSLTGPGGTGKTRLALQLAADLIELFEDGSLG